MPSPSAALKKKTMTSRSDKEKQVKKSVAAQIRELKDTMTVQQIAERLGVKPQYVHSVLYAERKKKGVVSTKRGRPRKFVTPVVEMAPVKREGEPVKTITLNMLRQTSADLQQIRVDQMEREIENLKTIIRYLEGKLYGAPV